MSGSHEGRVALVTGAGRGIGQAIAKLLSERGAHVVLFDREDPAETLGLLKQKGLSFVGDVTSDADWEKAVAAASDAFGRIDILVNNAGILPYVPFEATDYDLWRATLAVNLDAHFLAAKRIVPIMRANRYGRIVSISSNSVGSPIPGFSAYMASKMGVVGFARGLSNDLANDGITVNVVMPAFTDTPGTAAAPDEMRQGVMMAQAIKRIAQPDDIAGPVVFLTSDDAAFVTGQTLVADGGMYKIS